MRKIGTKILSIIVILSLALVLAVPGFAEEANATDLQDAIGGDGDGEAGVATIDSEVTGSITLFTYAEAEDEYLEFDDAVKYVREQMKYDSRSSQFYLYYLYHGDTMTSSIASSEMTNIMNEVYAHTGVGSEGDYIYQHLWSCNRYVDSFTQAGDDTWHVVYRIVPSSLSNGEKEREVDAKVQEVLDEIIVPCMSDYEKVGAIYDWLVSNCSYASHRESTVYSAWGAIVDGDAVCHGYSLALYKMLNDAGIDCRYEANYWHAWNIVNLGDYYYYCDSTWDNGKRSQFLKCWADFEDYYHTADSPWDSEEWTSQYPIAATSYNPDTATDGSNEPHHVYETTVSNGVTTHTCIYCGEYYTGDHSEEHHILHYDAVAPTCDEEGSVEYWHCLDCDTYYTDSSLSDASIATASALRVAATGHESVTHVAAVAPTEDTDGNVEYWYCSDCGEYFLDEALTEQATAHDVIVLAEDNKIDLTVNLSWTDADGNALSDDQIPDTAEIELMGVEDDGTSYIVATVVLSKVGGWTHTFTDLSGEISYTVMEMVAGDMVEVAYDKDAHILNVTAIVYDKSPQYEEPEENGDEEDEWEENGQEENEDESRNDDDDDIDDVTGAILDNDDDGDTVGESGGEVTEIVGAIEDTDDTDGDVNDADGDVGGDTDNVQTGDAPGVLAYGILVAAALGVMGCCVIRGRRRTLR